MAVRLKMYAVHENGKETIFLERPDHATLSSAIRSVRSFWKEVAKMPPFDGKRDHTLVYKIELVDTVTGKVLRTSYDDSTGMHQDGEVVY